MHTIIGSFGRDCIVVMLFQLYGSKAGLFMVIYSGWVSITPTFILKEELI